MEISVSLPVFAQAKFQFTAPEGWSEMSDEERKEAMCNALDLSTTGYLCYQCAKSLETDFEIDWNGVDTNYMPDFFKVK